MRFDDDCSQGYHDGHEYMFPTKLTQKYIDGWWEGKEDRDAEAEEEDMFLAYDMENQDEE